MKKIIMTALILAALSASALVSCGTVENVSDSSVLDILEDTTSEEATTEASGEQGETTEAVTTEADTSVTEVTTAGEEAATTSATAETPDVIIETRPATEAPTEAPTQAPTEAPTQAPTEAPAGSFEYDDMTFVHGGTYATVLADGAGLISALGTADSVEEAASCLSNGNDVKIYYYNSGINVYTYIENGREIIYEIELTSSAYKTPKGLAPGMTLADAEKLYGKNYTYSGGVVSYYATDTTYLYLYMSGDTIVSIGYAAEV